jgi:acetyl esterase/lipase
VAAWADERGSELVFDDPRLAIAGDSVGGNLATAVTLLAKERSGSAFRFQALFHPGYRRCHGHGFLRPGPRASPLQAPLIVEAPPPESLAKGLVVVVRYQTENPRILPLFGPAALDVSPR